MPLSIQASCFGPRNCACTLFAWSGNTQPSLCTSNVGVVTEGALNTAGTFKADSVLAKHDETYMPKEVADALKKQGHWKADGGYGLAGAASKDAPPPAGAKK